MPVIDGEFQPTTAAVRAIYANTVPVPDAGPAFDRWVRGQYNNGLREAIGIIEAKFFGGPTRDMLVSWLTDALYEDAPREEYPDV